MHSAHSPSLWVTVPTSVSTVLIIFWVLILGAFSIFNSILITGWDVRMCWAMRAKQGLSTQGFSRFPTVGGATNLTTGCAEVKPISLGTANTAKRAREQFPCSLLYFVPLLFILSFSRRKTGFIPVLPVRPHFCCLGTSPEQVGPCRVSRLRHRIHSDQRGGSSHFAARCPASCQLIF